MENSTNNSELSEIVKQLRLQTPPTNPPTKREGVKRRKTSKPLPFLHSFRINFDYLNDSELNEFLTDLFCLFFDKKEPPPQTNNFLGYCYRSAKNMLSNPDLWNVPEVRKIFLPPRFRAIFDAVKGVRNRSKFMRAVCSYAFDGVEAKFNENEEQLAHAFDNAKNALAEETARREHISRVRSEAGKKGAEISLEKRLNLANLEQQANAEILARATAEGRNKPLEQSNDSTL